MVRTETGKELVPCARFYDVLDKPMGMTASKWRGKLLTGEKGKVLEVRIGTGRNIPYYPDNDWEMMPSPNPSR